MDAPDPRAALSLLIERSGTSHAALSRLLGRNAAYLQQFVTRGTPRQLAEQDRRRLAAFFGVEEVLLGGPVRAGEAMVPIPRLDVAASAGPGALVEVDRAIGSLGLDARLLARLGARPADLSLIRASGRSMEPTISDGDELLVDRGDRRIGARGAIHVVRIDGALMVKRVVRIAGGYRILSDNPDVLPLETPDCDLIGRVVWLARSLK